MNRVERSLHARLMAGRKWTGDLAVSVYKEFGISAKLMESAYAARQSKVASAVELAKLNAKDLNDKVKAKAKQIADKERKLDRKRVDLALNLEKALKFEERAARMKAALGTTPEAKKHLALQQYKTVLGEMHGRRRLAGECHVEIKRIEADLHQHKRKMASLETRRAEAVRRIDSPSICFGTRKLFDAQYSLVANGFKSRAEWKVAWRKARSATFMIEGEKASETGNRFARFSRRDDGLFDLELRLPEALAHLADESSIIGGRLVHVVRFRRLTFSHEADLLEAAIASKTPVSVRFHRDETGWRVMASFKVVANEVSEDYRCGAIGVDLNVGFVSVTRADRHGNVIETFDVPMVTYGKSQSQSLDAVRKAAATVADYAATHGLPVVSEDIDFAEKKKRLKEDGDARYARMLSSFAYSGFDAALASACARHGVYHRRVNPAFTSLIGRVKFARRYGLSVHRAAALAIARRAMQLSEKLPLSFEKERRVTLPSHDARQLTLERPARKDPGQSQAAGSRHVWSDWKVVQTAFRGALAARGPSGRKRPSRSATGWSELRSMVRRRRRDVPRADTQSRGQRVVPDAATGETRWRVANCFNQS
jgi:IS605 OrfB family transposase